MHDKSNNVKYSDARQSLERVYTLAHEGQVPHAIVMWNKHQDRHTGCICSNKMFDQRLCGFCLLSSLQTKGLMQSCPMQADKFHASAQTISSYLTRRHPDVKALAAE